MPDVESLFGEDPNEWLTTLAEYQRDLVAKIVSDGKNLDEVAQIWTEVTAENTFRFGAAQQVGDKGFIKSLKKEIRGFLCGDTKYKKERDDLFGVASPTRQLVVSALAVAIAPHLSVASAVLAPVIAILFASVGKIAMNAWCDSIDW